MNNENIIPYHEAEFDDPLGKVTLGFGQIVQLEGGRRVEVWSIKEHEGIAIRIFRPAKHGKIAKLSFGLTLEAGGALLLALQKKLSVEPAPENTPPSSVSKSGNTLGLTPPAPQS